MLLFSCFFLTGSAEKCWDSARTDWQISLGTQTPCPLVITPKSPGPWLAVLQHCMTSLLGSVLMSQPWWDFCENTRQTVKGKQREKYIQEISSVSKEPSLGGRYMERLAHKALGLEMRTRLHTHSPCPTCEECPIFFHQPLPTKVRPSGKWYNIHQALHIRDWCPLAPPSQAQKNWGLSIILPKSFSQSLPFLSIPLTSWYKQIIRRAALKWSRSCHARRTAVQVLCLKPLECSNSAK